MSGSGDDFGEDVAKLENVRQLGSTEYLREYTGVLSETNERARINTLAPELVDIDAAVDAFTQVIDTWHNASANANIRTILERETEPRPWIAVPDDGETLAAIQPDIAPEAVETVISETADALRTLGLYNTVHGHLSPDDIYLNGTDETGELTVEVGGFGLEAAISAAVGEYEPTVYTPPELLDGSNQPTEQTDVYGLGAVSYFALTGQAPVSGADLDLAIRDGPSSPPSVYNNAIPAELDDVVMQALSPSPNDRYDSPYAFGRAFLSTFDADDFRPDATDQDSEDEAETTDSAESDEAVPNEDDDEPPSDEDDSVDSADTDETTVTRRAAVGLLGIGALGGAGWYLSRGQLTGADQGEVTAGEPGDQSTDEPADQNANELADQTATPESSDEPSSSSSVALTQAWELPSFVVVSRVDNLFLGYIFRQEGRKLGLVTTDGTVEMESDPVDDEYGFRRDGGDRFSVTPEYVCYGSRESDETNKAKLYAFSRETGDLLWTHLTGDSLRDIQIDYVTAGDDRVYYATGTEAGSSSEQDPFVRAVNLTSGEQVWETSFRGASYSGLKYHNGSLYANILFKLLSIDASEGAEINRCEFGTGIGGFAESDNILYGIDDDIYAFDLSADDMLYTRSVNQNPNSQLATDNLRVYSGDDDGYLTANDQNTGNSVWSTRLNINGSIRYRPAITEEHVWVVDEENYVYACSRESGEIVYEEQEEQAANPVAIENTLLVSIDRQDKAFTVETR